MSSAAHAENQGETAISAADLPLQRIYHWEQARAGVVFLTQPIRGEVREWTWGDAVGEARRMATWLQAQGWPPGSHIAILAKNSAWWMMAEFAIWMAGHVSVPIYASLRAETVRLLLEHCEAVACFTGAMDDERAGSVGMPAGVRVIGMPPPKGAGRSEWESVVGSCEPLAGRPLRDANELATIIYTSGTTGQPKGVMHRFSAFPYFAEAITRVVGDASSDRMLSYLPLAHIAERALVEAHALKTGMHLYFVEKADTFVADLQRARPTIFFSVPRLFLKFQQGVLEKVPQPKLDRLLRLPLVSRLVKQKILRQLGLDQTRLAASGSAALPLSVLAWFRKLGLNLVEGYGMSETGISHTPKGGQSRPGYVGDGIAGVETKLGENGEVLIRGPMNMMGYYKDPEATAGAFTPDGYFRTGDLGELDAEGWLKVTGRVKEQFKTSKGKYVSPARIEKLLSAHPVVENCCVVGAGMPRAFAMILLAKQPGTGSDEITCALQALLNQVNGELDAHERLGCLVVTDEAWTIENGFLTPTLKLKRAKLETHYGRHFDEWCGSKAQIVWYRGGAAAGA